MPHPGVAQALTRLLGQNLASLGITPNGTVPARRTALTAVGPATVPTPAVAVQPATAADDSEAVTRSHRRLYWSVAPPPCTQQRSRTPPSAAPCSPEAAGQTRQRTAAALTETYLLAEGLGLAGAGAPLAFGVQVESGPELLERLPVVAALSDDRPEHGGEAVAGYAEPAGPGTVLPGLVYKAFANVEDHSANHRRPYPCVTKRFPPGMKRRQSQVHGYRRRLGADASGLVGDSETASDSGRPGGMSSPLPRRARGRPGGTV